MKKMIIVLLGALFIAYGCEKNPSSPVEETEIAELTESEQMDIIASEIAADNGGVIADVQMASNSALSGSVASLPKTVGYDTTFTNTWITYAVDISFYSAEGREQVTYIDGLTDKIAYKGEMTGEYAPTAGWQEIYLEKSSSLSVAGITGSVLTINGSASNNSSYKYKGVKNVLDVTVESSYTVEDLKLNSASTTYLPENGKLQCKFKGTYSRDGVVKDKSVEYSFTVTVEFKGGSQVSVTLPSGTKFTLDLVTGDVSE